MVMNAAKLHINPVRSLARLLVYLVPLQSQCYSSPSLSPQLTTYAQLVQQAATQHI